LTRCVERCCSPPVVGSLHVCFDRKQPYLEAGYAEAQHQCVGVLHCGLCINHFPVPTAPATGNCQQRLHPCSRQHAVINVTLTCRTASIRSGRALQAALTGAALHCVSGAVHVPAAASQPLCS
jgi:hypothetical protein